MKLKLLTFTIPLLLATSCAHAMLTDDECPPSPKQNWNKSFTLTSGQVLERSPNGLVVDKFFNIQYKFCPNFTYPPGYHFGNTMIPKDAQALSLHSKMTEEEFEAALVKAGIYTPAN